MSLMVYILRIKKTFGCGMLADLDVFKVGEVRRIINDNLLPNGLMVT